MSEPQSTHEIAEKTKRHGTGTKPAASGVAGKGQDPKPQADLEREAKQIQPDGR